MIAKDKKERLSLALKKNLKKRKLFQKKNKKKNN
jgi:hypothetical protein|tara:strand:- start:1515 stop:1616 length:102 start_codon:yes stop_codon:yes gene_type:complete